MKICIFYHCLFFLGNPPKILENGCEIIAGQMKALRDTRLLDASDEMHIGINGGEESREVGGLFLPRKAQLHFHGLQCRNENRTIICMEEWLKSHTDWIVLYFHCKGASHEKYSEYHRTVSGPWREKMMQVCIHNWRACVSALEGDIESCGDCWMSGPGMPLGQSIWAGNFWWAKAEFLATLPTIMARDRLKVSGIDAIESRYEAEVWIGNGPRLPKVKAYA